MINRLSVAFNSRTKTKVQNIDLRPEKYYNDNYYQYHLRNVWPLKKSGKFYLNTSAEKI